MRSNLPVTQREYLIAAGTTLVSCTNLQSHITYCNPAFIEVSGFSRDELVGQPHNLIRHPDMPAEAFRDMWATLQAGRPWTGLVKNRRKNGDHYWVRANVTPVLEGGRVNGYMSVRTAVTRDESAAAQDLYARMRDEAADGRRLHRLEAGELHVQAPLAQMARHLRPGLGGRLLWGVTGTGLAAGLCVGLLASLGWPAQLLAAGLVSLAVAFWVRGAALAPLHAAIATINRMSAGDLTQSMPAQRMDEVGQLARGLTQLNVNLQAIVGDVCQQVQGMTLASQEIAGGNHDLGRRTETQAGNLQQTAASVEQITGTVQQTAKPPGWPLIWRARPRPQLSAVAWRPRMFRSACATSAPRPTASRRSSAPSMASRSRPTSWP